MIRKKMIATAALLSLAISSILPSSGVVGWEKRYAYAEETVRVAGHGQSFHSKETREAESPKESIGMRLSGVAEFASKKDLFIIRIDRSKSPESRYRISVKIGGKTKAIEMDVDSDERSLSDRFITSEPIIADRSDRLEYSIESSSANETTEGISITGVDTSSFTQHLVFGITDTALAQDSNIITRKQWGADETLRYKDHPKWQAIFSRQSEPSDTPKSEWAIKQEKRIRDIRKYLSSNFPLEDTPVSTRINEGGHELVWPIEKTKRVEKIVVHHTAEMLEADSRSDEEIVRSIYYYHAITKGWGDIGYNYLIGRDGKIYEGRAGGDYSVGAHALWNNKSTVGISVMGNFEATPVGELQMKGADYAIAYLAKKFGIDVNGTSIAHKECTTNESCLLKDFQMPNLIGHKDVSNTTCPGTNLYVQIPEVKSQLVKYTRNLSYIENTKIEVDSSSLPRGPNVRIRLSYTGDTVQIRSFTPEKMKIQVGNRGGMTKLSYMNFEKRGLDGITLVVGKKRLKVPSITISSTVLEIPSWTRKPPWDSSGLINDNKFRGSITIYNDNGKLTLINELPLEYYLRGLGEVSNDENEDKAKTILISARTYALWYTDPANRKFPGKPYDGSDNPDEFQKYLGYSFELRSPNITGFVDDTNATVIKYAGKIIKPWYFNQSNGKTRSYKEYCEMGRKAGPDPSLPPCEDVPYLQSVDDPAGIEGGGFKGHGVGISGAGAKYLSEMEGMKYPEIIGYFLKGVTVEKISY